jgi:hypothetical protein
VDVDPLGERATIGAQLGAMMLAGSLLAAIADARAWRSRCGRAISPTLAASRAKARLVHRVTSSRPKGLY